MCTGNNSGYATRFFINVEKGLVNGLTLPLFYFNTGSSKSLIWPFVCHKAARCARIFLDLVAERHFRKMSVKKSLSLSHIVFCRHMSPMVTCADYLFAKGPICFFYVKKLFSFFFLKIRFFKYQSSK